MSLRWRMALLTATLAHGVEAAPLTDAFNQGTALGRSGNQAARGQITGNTAATNVPGYTATPPQTAYFGAAGIATSSAAAAQACAGGATDPTCSAVNFSQTNASRRPNFTIAPNDPLRASGKAITADPEAIAGNLTGTYSDCTVEPSKAPTVFETLMCHEYRTQETLTCDKVLNVAPISTPGCSPGQFLTRVTANPCPSCIDSLAYDFTCAANGYTMHVFTIEKKTGRPYADLGNQNVPGTLNTQIAKTAGPSRVDDYYCYQTFYSQSCAGANCTIGAWFNNPCQGTSNSALSTFVMPTTLSFKDTWDDQCAALEARAQ